MRQMRYIIFMMAITVTTLVCGQFPASYGVKAGVSLANQSWQLTNLDYTLETEVLSGFTAALFMEAFKGEHFSLQFDAAYALKGSSSTTESISVQHLENDAITVNEGERSTSEFAYISLAPMARFRFDLEHLVPYVLLGPRVDFLLSYTTDSEYPLDTWKGYTVGLSIGAGLEYRLGQFNLFAEIQYQPDLSPLTNQEPLLINNELLAFMLGFRRVVSF